MTAPPKSVLIRKFAFEGLQLSLSDFTKFKIRLFLVSKAVILTDGRVRVCMTGQIETGDGQLLARRQGNKRSGKQGNMDCLSSPFFREE